MFTILDPEEIFYDGVVFNIYCLEEWFIINLSALLIFKSSHLLFIFGSREELAEFLNLLDQRFRLVYE